MSFKSQLAGLTVVEFRSCLTRFEPATVTCSPHDPAWFWWYTPIFGPGIVTILAYCHHLDASKPGPVNPRAVAVALGLKFPWDENHPMISALGVVSKFKLCWLEDDVLRLISPIPRPSPAVAARLASQQPSTGE